MREKRLILWQQMFALDNVLMILYSPAPLTSVVELTGDVAPDVRAIAKADVIVTTPEKWDGVSRSWQTRNYVQAVSVLIIDEIHLLGEMMLFSFLNLKRIYQLHLSLFYSILNLLPI